jgi:hypothetical protein
MVKYDTDHITTTQQCNYTTDNPPIIAIKMMVALTMQSIFHCICSSSLKRNHLNDNKLLTNNKKLPINDNNDNVAEVVQVSVISNVCTNNNVAPMSIPCKPPINSPT